MNTFKRLVQWLGVWGGFFLLLTIFCITTLIFSYWAIGLVMSKIIMATAGESWLNATATSIKALRGLIGVAFGILLFVAITTFTVWRGFKKVPEKEAWLIELFGAYHATWKSGPHFLFPHFGIMTISCEVPLWEQEVSIFQGGDAIDFADASNLVEASLIFKIHNPYQAQYEIGDVLRALITKVEESVKGYLAQMTVDEANKLKFQIDLHRILNEQLPKDGKFLEKIEAKKSDLWQYINKEWGVDIVGISIVDIIYTEEQKAARDLVHAKQKALEAAEIDKALAEAEKIARKTRAEAVSIELQEEGKGFALKVKAVTKTGVNPNEALKHVTAATIAEALAKGGKAVVITGNNGAGFGASMFLGAEAVKP